MERKEKSAKIVEFVKETVSKNKAVFDRLAEI